MAPLEPWERVLVEVGFLENDPHGRISCVSCHEGDSRQSDKDQAHVNLVKYPSEQAETYCIGCHDSGNVYDAIMKFDDSLHLTQEGYFVRFEERAGFDLRGDAHLLEEFNKECGKCHASCGQCHISRPVSVDGGFLNGHEFQLRPDMKNNCTACHGARVGAEYFGENTTYTDANGDPIKGDVHRFTYLKQCDFCHDAEQMHGASGDLTYRYDPDNTAAARCEDCHDGSSDSNAYHQMHWSGAGSKLACQVCHSQPYKSCNSCHVGEGITGSSYQTFKIGKNYMKSAQRDYDYITVRHIPIAPDTFEGWGVTDLPNYEDSEPTWKLATPHNIQRWTAQTTVAEDASCWENCHNSDYYLKEEDISLYNPSDYVDREIEANRAVFMP